MRRTPPVIRTRFLQHTLANTLNVSQATVSHWLNMKTQPTGLTKKALERYYPGLAKKIEEEWNSQTSESQ